MRNLFLGLVALLAVGSRAIALDAQVFTPIYVSPRMTNDLGAAFSDGPGRFSVEAIWRGGPYGLRVGYADAAGGLLSLGGEFRNMIPIPDAAVGLVLSGAVQTLLGDENAFGAQVGLSGGYPFGSPGLIVTPYLHPRVALVRGLGEAPAVAFEPMADLGIDFEIEQTVVLRFGTTLRSVGATWGLALSILQ